MTMVLGKFLSEFRNLPSTRQVPELGEMRRSKPLLDCWRWGNSASRRRIHCRIGCASGFWGDSAVSTPQFLRANDEEKLDFIVYDYLSEITMSLLARAKAKDPIVRFTTQQSRPKIVANAGGLNPIACANALHKLATEAGMDSLKIAAVTGDDIIGKKDLIEPFAEETPFVSVNAYLGAEPIKRALDFGADIVITGRCTDSSLTLGPLMHHYGWDLGNLEALATGSLAGHLIECGAQATGGIFTDWSNVPNWENIGFPIAHFPSDSDEAKKEFAITKLKGTGGLVTFGTVAEQLVYEIGNPGAYLLPDVSLDMTQVSIQDNKDGKVNVSGAIGSKPSATHKVTATYLDGYRCTAVCPIVGPRCVDKGLKTSEAIINRCRGIFSALKLGDFKRTDVQIIGSNKHSTNSSAILAGSETREAVIWMAVEHSSKKALEIFAREIAPAGTGMGEAGGVMLSVEGPLEKFPRWAPSIIGPISGKSEIQAEIHINGEKLDGVSTVYSGPFHEPNTPIQSGQRGDVPSFIKPGQRQRLEEVAYARSGDKGNTANIGVVCRSPADYDLIKRQLTAERVSEFFSHAMESTDDIARYELPGIAGLNFVLPNSLGGGGIASLRFDPQGKGMAQNLLDIELSF